MLLFQAKNKHLDVDSVVAHAERAQGIRAQTPAQKRKAEEKQQKLDERAAKLQRKQDEKAAALTAKNAEASRLTKIQAEMDIIVLRGLNLNDFDPQTFVTCHSKIYDCMKSREKALVGMRASGNHESDFWMYAQNQTYLKWRVGSNLPIPAKAVYYCHVMCSQYPAIDGKFADALASDLKSDSNVPLAGEAGVSRGKGGTKNDKLLLEKMDNAMRQSQDSQQKSFEQRQAFMDLQRDSAAQSTTREDWKEYISLGREFKAIRAEEDPDNDSLLHNIASRLHVLEKCCKIPDAKTITAGYGLED